MRMLEAVRAWWEPEWTRPQVPGLPRAPRGPDALKVPLGEAEDGRSVEWRVDEGSGHLAVIGLSGPDAVMSTVLAHLFRHRGAWRVRLVDTKGMSIGWWAGHPVVEKAADDPGSAARVLGHAAEEADRRRGLLAREGLDGLGELNGLRALRGEAPLPRVAVMAAAAEELLLEPVGEEDPAEAEARRARRKRLEALVRDGADAGVHVILAAQRERAVAGLAGIGGLDTLRMRPGFEGSLGAAEYRFAPSPTGMRIYLTEPADLEKAGGEEGGG